MKERTLQKIDSVFEVVFLMGFFIGFVVRKIYTIKSPNNKAVKKYKSAAEIILLAVTGMAMILPFFFILTTWLDFADYHLPRWLGWIGTAVFAMALLILWRSHADLATNWSPLLQIKQQHSLITSGIYRRIRHPMYAAHLLWATAQGLLLGNWLAGWTFLVVSIPLYLIRIPKEERMMLEQFGGHYKQYVRRTGRIIPPFWNIRNKPSH
ncbi:MAG: isoprenylcysteine carboxylmethyltransferase family protein [Sedimentisphaerales bacterium]|nr:isoprenylcysteine carboxylmethyltransferase family protein [Sedimentisphaerales bacterium]